MTLQFTSFYQYVTLDRNTKATTTIKNDVTYLYADTLLDVRRQKATDDHGRAKGGRLEYFPTVTNVTNCILEKYTLRLFPIRAKQSVSGNGPACQKSYPQHPKKGVWVCVV